MCRRWEGCISGSNDLSVTTLDTILVRGGLYPSAVLDIIPHPMILLPTALARRSRTGRR